jgi:(1->4)-alpha-D-glucan 1-alpha-D-glucosylmutase
MIARQRRSPSALSATSTHDTKRGEDVRARLNVLSEIPGEWKASNTRWRTVNRRYKTAIRGTLVPDPNDEYLIYQTLIGIWPFETGLEAETAFRDRVVAYMTKALREAKVHTSWLSPDEEYEAAVERFVRAILDRRRPNLFLQAFEPLEARVAQLGIYNSLAQLLIKITAPGVPDFYQGTELWDLNLVDPDNRRPVDYDARRRALAGLKDADPSMLLAQRADGRVKMFVANRALDARAGRRDLYQRGDYVPIQANGSRRECLFAFARTGAGVRPSGGSQTGSDPDDIAITCVPRLIATLTPDGSAPLGHAVWGDTQIEVSDGRAFRDVFTGAVVEVERTERGYSLPAAAIFERFPVALLVPAHAPDRPDPLTGPDLRDLHA